jgi:WD40 repeat protein
MKKESIFIALLLLTYSSFSQIGKPSVKIPFSGGGQEGVIISPDSRYIVTRSYDNKATIWDVKTGVQVNQTSFANIDSLWIIDDVKRTLAEKKPNEKYYLPDIDGKIESMKLSSNGQFLLVYIIKTKIGSFNNSDEIHEAVISQLDPKMRDELKDPKSLSNDQLTALRTKIESATKELIIKQHIAIGKVSIWDVINKNYILADTLYNVNSFFSSGHVAFARKGSNPV